MIPAALSLDQSKPPPRELIPGARAAQMGQRSQCLLALQARRADSLPRQNGGDAAVQIGRRQFDRVTGDDACIQAVEPARLPIAPRSILDDQVIADAIA